MAPPAAAGPATGLSTAGAGYTTGVESRTATGTIGGRYRIQGLLGEGGMARVFDAFDDRLERPVAVKVLRPETEALPGMRKRFQQEARLAARLIHPNIVSVLDYGEDGASSYLVMERLPGTTLRDEMARGPMAAPRVVLVMTEALAALAAAHKFGVLHRDVKPSNILLQDDGHTKLSDFGIAKSVDLSRGAEMSADDVTLAGVILGTPGYLAPERRSGHPATAQSDLYSVGAVLVEALTGRRAHTGTIFTDALPPRLRAVARRALATDPNQRFPSADAMLHALRPSRPSGVAAPPLPTERLAPVPVAALPLPAVPAATAHPGTATLHRPPPVEGLAPARHTRRRRLFLGALVAAALTLSLVVLAGHDRPTGPTAGATSHHAAHPGDSEGTAVRQLAASLAGAGQPGDRAMASALEATAGQQPGPRRTASAENALSLAEVLLAGGGLTPVQYQDVVTTLQPTGAAVPTTTTTTTAPPPPAHGPGHSHHNARRRTGPAGVAGREHLSASTRRETSSASSNSAPSPEVPEVSPAGGRSQEGGLNPLGAPLAIP